MVTRFFFACALCEFHRRRLGPTPRSLGHVGGIVIVGVIALALAVFGIIALAGVRLCGFGNVRLGCAALLAVIHGARASPLLDVVFHERWALHDATIRDEKVNGL